MQVAIFNTSWSSDTAMISASKKSPLLSLSDELLLHVLSYLDVGELVQAGRVNRRFHALSEDHTLWQTIFQQHGCRSDEKITPERRQRFILEEIQKAQKSFQDSLSCLHSISDSDINRVLMSTPRYFLQNVVINADRCRECSITGNALQAVVQKYPHLQSLQLQTTDIRKFTHLTDDALIGFAKSAKKMTALLVSGAPQITEEGYIQVSKEASLLREISISSDVLSDRVVSAIVTDHKNLITLKIAGECKNISDKALKAIGDHALSLQTLEVLIYRPAFSHERVKKLMPFLRNTRVFSLQGTKKLSDNVVIEITRCLKQSEALYLGNCSKVKKKSIDSLSGLENLESLDLLHCKKPENLKRRVSELQTRGCFKKLKRCEITG